MKSDGSVLVLVLIVITIFLCLSSSLAIILRNEIKINSYNENRLKALYKAEAGINKAIYMINQNQDITKIELENISGKIETEKDFRITNVSINNYGGKKEYTISAVGYSHNIKKEIVNIYSP